ncbi:hypothetical protein CIRMBP1208_01223 [Enterococcus cecorum]|nr:hypothetical protein CIRMBP1208_01223 [Enterococcus cecorum]
MISILIILNLTLIILNLTLLICSCYASRGNGGGVKGKVPKNRPVPRP